MSLGEPLPADFFDRDPREVAVDIIGFVLAHRSPEGVTSGIIVETEAYRPDDPACHAYRGPTMRNRTIFGPPGLAYVYLSYGMHSMLNVVCEPEGVGSAVLVRALRPLEGKDLMARRRGRSSHLCDGPGRLAQALGIGLHHDGCDLTRGPIVLRPGAPPEGEIVSTTRVGISRGTGLPWRYLLLGDPDVSVHPKVVFERGLVRSDYLAGSGLP
ncbi:DNA-3-methyladenine glycosylase [Rubrobacter calidifluminis]|uniref:DNA-3-methyladenine glycosylase n=1 Tax=Rubrobacter calidifluminis TaxID=1392640 RepID=UPI002361C687|nr:DNA-3-methyladenine glycosylase [Rubrobacter calidifluminis]